MTTLCRLIFHFLAIIDILAFLVPFIYDVSQYSTTYVYENYKLTLMNQFIVVEIMSWLLFGSALFCIFPWMIGGLCGRCEDNKSRAVIYGLICLYYIPLTVWTGMTFAFFFTNNELYNLSITTIYSAPSYNCSNLNCEYDLGYQFNRVCYFNKNLSIEVIDITIGQKATYTCITPQPIIDHIHDKQFEFYLLFSLIAFINYIYTCTVIISRELCYYDDKLSSA